MSTDDLMDRAMTALAAHTLRCYERAALITVDRDANGHAATMRKPCAAWCS